MSVQYDGYRGPVAVAVDGLPRWTRRSAKEGNAVEDLDNKTRQAVVPWWCSSIFGDVNHIVYKRARAIAFDGVYYDSGSFSLRRYSAPYGRDPIQESSLYRTGLHPKQEISASLFGFDRPSNSLFIPPEFMSINCHVCTTTIVYHTLTGSPFTILDGNGQTVSEKEEAEYTSTVGAYCGLPDPATFGFHKIYHAVNYGDGLPETKYQYVPVVRGGILVSEVDFSHVFGTAGDCQVSARAGCMACFDSPFAVRPRRVHTEARCATIANFARKGVDEDHPGTGDMTVYYAWESSTGRGRLEDFRNCKMRECVRCRDGTRCDSRWRRFAWPSPWRRIGTEDPTILPKEEQDQIVLANGGGAQDTHHSRIKHIRPRYTEAEFSAKQLYQAYCPCQKDTPTSGGVATWQNVSLLQVITRSVYRKEETGKYWYRITKGVDTHEVLLPGQEDD